MCENCNLFYLAGMIDGEGCIFIGLRYNLQLSITNTNKESLEFLQRQFGGHLYFSKGPDLQWRDYGRLVWMGKVAKEVLVKVVNKLIIKREQAELAITFPVGDCGHRHTEENDKLRDAIRTRMRVINKPGVQYEEQEQ